MFNIYFLRNDLPRLEMDIRKKLFVAACYMFKRGHKTQKVKGRGFEGRLTTQFTSVLIGQVGGIVFEATVDTNFGTGSCGFIVRDADVVNWMNRIPDFVSTSPVPAGTPVRVASKH